MRKSIMINGVLLSASLLAGLGVGSTYAYWEKSQPIEELHVHSGNLNASIPSDSRATFVVGKLTPDSSTVSIDSGSGCETGFSSNENIPSGQSLNIGSKDVSLVGKLPVDVTLQGNNLAINVKSDLNTAVTGDSTLGAFKASSIKIADSSNHVVNKITSDGRYYLYFEINLIKPKPTFTKADVSSNDKKLNVTINSIDVKVDQVRGDSNV